jgi:hypothetical protein
MSKMIVCVYCGRRGERGFVVSSGNPDLRYGQTTWCCQSARACERRQRKAEEVMFRDNMAASDDESIRSERVTARSRVTFDLDSAL